jgi:hypothetical protein
MFDCKRRSALPYLYHSGLTSFCRAEVMRI